MHFKSKHYGEIKGWRPHRRTISNYVKIIQPNNLNFVCQITVCKSVEEAADQAYSYIVVTTKALPEMNPTSRILRPFLEPNYSHPQPTYVLIQNGLGVEKDLYNALIQLNRGVPRIFNTSLFIYTNLSTDNLVEHGELVRDQII